MLFTCSKTDLISSEPNKLTFNRPQLFFEFRSKSILIQNILVQTTFEFSGSSELKLLHSWDFFKTLAIRKVSNDKNYLDKYFWIKTTFNHSNLGQTSPKLETFTLLSTFASALSNYNWTICIYLSLELVHLRVIKNQSQSNLTFLLSVKIWSPHTWF